MPRADYYIISASDYDSRERLACQLSERALRAGQRVHIHTLNDSDMNQLDQSLWNFRPDSFVPHALMGSQISAPITLGNHSLPDNLQSIDVLINLGKEPLPGSEKIARNIEIVSQADDVLSATRHSYLERKSAGWELHRHDMRTQQAP